MTRVVSSAALIACAVFHAGCLATDEAKDPDGTTLYFPTGLLVSPGGTTLYVANSDFDLQFSAGSVQALDLKKLRTDFATIPAAVASGQSVAEACGSFGINGDTWLVPTRCAPFAVGPYVQSFRFIGAFASGLLLTHNPNVDDGGARLFVPVRGDPSITYFDVSDDRPAASDPSFVSEFELDCHEDTRAFCNAANQLGRDPARNLRGVQLPADPVGIAATADGRAIVTAHQTQAAASLVINDWDTHPELAYFASNLATGPTEVVAIPEPAFVAIAEAQATAEDTGFVYQRGFAVTFRAAAEIDLLRFVPDSGAVPPRPFLVRASALAVSTSASNFDSRGIAVMDDERKLCEATCGASVDELDCLVQCAEKVPLRVFMANREPASLLIGQMTTVIQRTMVNGAEVVSGATEDLVFYDTIPLSFGPSRVEVGNVIDTNGELSARVFAVAFDSRRVFMVHPYEDRLEAVIRTGRGPHDVAFDVGVGDDGERHAYLLVGHFTDSWIGVVDLDQRRPYTYVQMFAAVGIPVSPTESN